MSDPSKVENTTAGYSSEEHSAKEHPAEENIDNEPKHDARFVITFLLICVCQFLVALDLVILAAALPAIAASLNATSNEAYWCGTGYVLAQCITQPIYGTLSEIFGRRIPLLFAIFVFLLASILCARADDISWLIATRVVRCPYACDIEVG